VFKKANREIDSLDVEENGHLKTALEALRLLIIEKLESGQRTRFASVASLCDVAQSLMRSEANPRIPKSSNKVAYREAFEEGDEGEYGPATTGGITFVGEPVLYQDPRQHKRNNSIQMDALSQVGIESQRAQWAAAEVQELRDLLTVRDLIGASSKKGLLDARIAKLLKNIGDRTENGNLVHSELSRGSSTGGSESNRDLSADVQPVQCGTEGDGILQEEGSEGRDSIQAMGDR
jgi:hypothetical protein